MTGQRPGRISRRPANPDRSGPGLTARGDSTRRWATAGAVAVLVVTAAIIVLGHIPLPAFPDLAADPDPSVPGRVAYVDAGAGDTCVMVVAASGSQPRELTCSLDWPEALAWTPDGDLVVVAYDERGPELTVIDIDDGTVARRLPVSPDDELRVLTDERATWQGRRLETGRSDGRAEVLARDAAGAGRVLVAVDGIPRDYRFESAQWSPDGRWVLVLDSRGRMLVVGADGSPAARQLVGSHQPTPARPAWYIPGTTTHTLDPADL